MGSFPDTYNDLRCVPTNLWHRDFFNFNLSLPRARKEEETVLSSRVPRTHSYAQIPSYSLFSSSNACHAGLGKGCLRQEHIEGTVTLSLLTVP